uniref:Uncharacterized protein n=1 Tax=Chromera velia CCMP2878 TaxID=1169474 RepID=A0A0G4H910_9ALVE|eukprot:Cvel_5938.t1-p1 / transcript=Cvel_5938.t1 / gene=Cvel_5938 / organism=Chromera_velia_CCMP2878 / gene_product=hypothetical protein / transcript_product=hypothetical protein / location=Cvel_scaffold284:29619-30710(+) / protein_length=364 / sequence_SO=supercontig / SO=protein_coding / is_pseudo=false
MNKMRFSHTLSLVFAILLDKGIAQDDLQSCDVYPDPHFRTWDNIYYDYHGGTSNILHKTPTADLSVDIAQQAFTYYSAPFAVGITTGQSFIEISGTETDPQNAVRLDSASMPLPLPATFPDGSTLKIVEGNHPSETVFQFENPSNGVIVRATLSAFACQFRVKVLRPATATGGTGLCHYTTGDTTTFAASVPSTAPFTTVYGDCPASAFPSPGGDFGQGLPDRLDLLCANDGPGCEMRIAGCEEDCNATVEDPNVLQNCIFDCRATLGDTRFIRQYEELGSRCPNECSGRGRCRFGVCFCVEGRTGTSCSVEVTDDTPACPPPKKKEKTGEKEKEKAAFKLGDLDLSKLGDGLPDLFDVFGKKD